MSKLERLIAELCPDGVEYRKLNEIATISRGGSFQKKDFIAAGFPCIHYGQIYTLYSLFVEKTENFISEKTAEKQKKASTNDIIMAVTSENIEDVCKCIAWLGEGEVAVSGHTAIIHHSLDPKYLVYYLRSSSFYAQKVKLAHGTKVIEVRADSLGDITVPVPPIEVQREIARVLDRYTDLNTELSTKLSAEISSRKKQYEYYLNNILTPDNSVPQYSLNELCLFIRNGMTYKADRDRSRRYKVSRIETISNGVINLEKTATVDDINEEYRLIEGDILFSHINSISWLGNTAFYEESMGNLYHGMNLLCFRADQRRVIPRYLFYMMRTSYFRLYVERYAKHAINQCSLSISDIVKWSIPVPSIIEQEKAVERIDTINVLINEITDRLSEEINKRQQQYEYYRDQLLAFADLKREATT